MKTIVFACLSILLAVGLTTSAAAKTSSSSTLKSVLDHYTAIQNALAHDTMDNVIANARGIIAVVRQHQTKAVPAAIAREADTLAKAESIYEARDAFKALSQSLIACLKAHPDVPGAYYEFYCPTDKASWLQTSQTPMNPYYGLRAETPTWGSTCPAEEKGEFGSAASHKG